MVGVIAWIVTTFSLAPLVTTFYPNVTLTQIFSAFIACAVIGVVFMGAILVVPLVTPGGRGTRASGVTSPASPPAGVPVPGLGLVTLGL